MSTRDRRPPFYGPHHVATWPRMAGVVLCPGAELMEVMMMGERALGGSLVLDGAISTLILLVVAMGAYDYFRGNTKAEEAAGYGSLLDNIPVGVYRSAIEGRFIEVNRALVELLGYDTREELLALDLTRDLYVYPEDRQHILKVLQEEGALDGYDALVRTKQGVQITVRVHGCVVRDAQGNVTGVEGVLMDVTEQKKAREALRDSEERYRRLVEQAPVPIAVHDGRHFLYANAGAARLLGATGPEDLIGRPVLAFVPPQDHALAAERMKRAFAGERLEAIEERLIRLDGEEIDVEVAGSMVTYQGRPAVQLVARDVTEQKRTEARLVEAKEHAEEMMQIKSSFLANISHEVRTPLAGIIGFATILQEELQQEHREMIDLIRQSGERLLETLNSVLDLARLESKAAMLNLEPLDIGEEVRSAARLFIPAAERKGLVFKVSLPEAPATARLDRAALHRVLTNLLSNAIKFTDAGGIEVTVDTQDEEVQIQVLDSGVGISEDFKPHLFDEFRQERDNVNAAVGSGLGLAITKQLIDMMGGRVVVKSRKGEGSVFQLFFPRLLPSLRPAHAAGAYSE